MAKKKDKGLKCIICGPRDFFDVDTVFKAIEESGFTISEVVSGAAKGVDSIGEQWAREMGVPVSQFVPDWNNIDVDGACVKTNNYGKTYNAKAGFMRNQAMADYAEACIAIDNGTPGTEDMIDRATKAGLKMFIFSPACNNDGEEFLFHL